MALTTLLFFQGRTISAPQQIFQSNKQIKYGASRVWGAHIIRFGATVNGIAIGALASFYGLAPYLNSYVNFAQLPQGTVLTTPFYSCNLATNPDVPFSGCDSNIADYPFTGGYVGNGQGFLTELPAFGYPAGGLFDTRFEAYVGDSWKFRPNLTLNYGLRYLRDTGRTDSDLAPDSLLGHNLDQLHGQSLGRVGTRIGQPGSPAQQEFWSTSWLCLGPLA